MSLTDADLSRAEAQGRLAARDQLGVRTCPYEADGDAGQRVLAARFVHAYVGAGGLVDDGEEEDVPENEIAARGGAKRWRVVKLRNGKYIKVAVVKRKGTQGGTTVVGPVRIKKES